MTERSGPLSFIPRPWEGTTDRLVEGAISLHETRKMGVDQLIPSADLVPNTFARFSENMGTIRDKVGDFVTNKSPFSSGREPGAHDGAGAVSPRGAAAEVEKTNPFKQREDQQPRIETELPSDVTYYGTPMPSTSAANLEAGNPFKAAVEQQSESALPTDGPAPEQKPAFEKMEIGDTTKESEQELE